MITWDDPDQRYFETGVDRGVLYPTDGPAVAWNGITGFNESGNGASTLYYIDGQIYLADMDATDFSGKLKAFFFPEEFAVCVGIPEIAEGFYADNQKPKRFGFSYRSLIGSGTTGDMFGYQIHLVYQAMASISERSRKTLTKQPDPNEFEFDIVATPIKLEGIRPTAHFIIDTRHLDPESIAELEALLYGDEAMLPSPETLFELMNFGEIIYVTGTETTVNFKGKRSKVYLIDDKTLRVDGIDVVDNGDGSYTISDGSNTVVNV